MSASTGFNAGTENALWDRLSVEVRSEVDSLVLAGRNVQAIAVCVSMSACRRRVCTSVLI